MATKSRPAQGNNSNKPHNRPRPAYRSDAAPVVVGRGTLSRPKSAGARFKGTRLAPDATPKIVTL